MERLLQHYHSCLRERFDLWFGENTVTAERVGTTWVLGFQQRTAGLSFLPERCCWTIHADGKTSQGTFDKMSKKIRQYFSGISLS